MKQTLNILEFSHIINQLKSYTKTERAGIMAESLKPSLSEIEIKRSLKETTQARRMLDEIGSPPIPNMDQIEVYVEKCIKGDLLLPEQIEQIGVFLTSVRRLKCYLEKGKERQISLAFYSDNLILQNELNEEIQSSIRAGKIEDSASEQLKDIRKKIQNIDEKIKQKAENILRANRSYISEAFVVTRNGRTCIPLKKEYRDKIQGTIIDKSASGATIFIEPKLIATLSEELAMCQIEEDTEERRILYVLADMIAEKSEEIFENIATIVKLDFAFSKGNLSIDYEGIEPEINLENYICLTKARHPLLNKEACVPIDFKIGEGINGIVITGPNTGGKTVAIKTVGLISIMACSGLHVPCENANIAIHNQVFCDIGDGQSVSNNLSTFSAHIKNVLNILEEASEESLVIIDELGSGTDPAEGMGIAIAVLEQLKSIGCLFLVTTHYPEVKAYAESHDNIINARMAFDRESLKPLYHLEIGKPGESCALYIAKKLGVPNYLLKIATQEAYGKQASQMTDELGLDKKDECLKKRILPKVQRKVANNRKVMPSNAFKRGDSVLVFPEQKIGIVVEPADQHGEVLVQVKKEKFKVNQKRLKLKVSSQELYPEDYDFSIIFDTVENRKKRHKMGKKYQEELTITIHNPY